MKRYTITLVTARGTTSFILSGNPDIVNSFVDQMRSHNAECIAAEKPELHSSWTGVSEKGQLKHQFELVGLIDWFVFEKE